MTRWGMVIDEGACTGCGACIVACRQENNVPDVTEAVNAAGRSLDWIQLSTQIDGEYETLKASQFPLFCQQCDEPPCIEVCPVRATYRDEEGIVGQIYNRCIGCRYCTNACPYSVKTFNWLDAVRPAGTERGYNPRVSRRPRGVVEKCTFCHQRRQWAEDAARAEGRPLRRGEYTPACVEACPARAMAFGDLDDPTSDVRRLSDEPRAERLMEDLGTEPKVALLRAPGRGD